MRCIDILDVYWAVLVAVRMCQRRTQSTGWSAGCQQGGPEGYRGPAWSEFAQLHSSRNSGPIQVVLSKNITQNAVPGKSNSAWATNKRPPMDMQKISARSGSADPYWTGDQRGVELGHHPRRAWRECRSLGVCLSSSRSLRRFVAPLGGAGAVGGGAEVRVLGASPYCCCP